MKKKATNTRMANKVQRTQSADSAREANRTQNASQDFDPNATVRDESMEDVTDTAGDTPEEVFDTGDDDDDEDEDLEDLDKEEPASPSREKDPFQQHRQPNQNSPDHAGSVPITSQPASTSGQGSGAATPGLSSRLDIVDQFSII